MKPNRQQTESLKLMKDVKIQSAPRFQHIVQTFDDKSNYHKIKTNIGSDQDHISLEKIHIF